MSLLNFECLDFDNIRDVDHKFVKQLADNIKINGLQQKIVVYPSFTKGRFKIFDGHHRYCAIRKLRKEDPQWNQVPCIIKERPKSEVDLRINQTITNLVSKTFSAADIGKALRLIKSTHITNDEIAKRLNKSPAWVTLHLRVDENGDLPLKKANREGKISNKSAQDLSMLSPEDQEKWLVKILNEKKSLAPKEASKVEKDLVEQALKQDKPAGAKPRMPRPLPKKQLTTWLVDNYDIVKNGKGENDDYTAKLEDVIRGVAFVYGAGEDALEEHFNIEKWFESTFGDPITDMEKWLS